MKESFEDIHVKNCSKPNYCLSCEMEEEQDMLCDSAYLLEEDIEEQKYPYLTKNEREQRIQTILGLLMRDPKPNCEKEC